MMNPSNNKAKELHEETIKHNPVEIDWIKSLINRVDNS